MEKKLFSPSDFIKLFGFVAGLMTLYFNIKGDMRDFISEQKAANEIISSRVSVLEISAKTADNRMNDFEKFQFRTEAILEDKLKIKKQK